MTSSLKEFTLVALGRSREMSKPISSAEDLAWARSTLACLPRMQTSAEAAGSERSPSGGQLAALVFVIGERVSEATEEYAASRVSPSKDRPGAVVINGGYLKSRTIWLEEGRLRVEMKGEASASGDKGKALIEPTARGLFSISVSIEAFSTWKTIPELSRRIDAKLGFERESFSKSAMELAQRIGGEAGLPKGANAIIDAIALSLGNGHGNSEKIMVDMADLACARRAALLLFPNGVQGALAQRFWLTGPNVAVDGNLSELGAGEFAEAALVATAQAPETLALCAAFAPILEMSELGLNAAGKIKRELSEKYGLTAVGWKSLVALSVRNPGAVFELANPCAEKDWHQPKKAGVYNPRQDGTPVLSESTSGLREVCMLASLCAAGGIDLEGALESMMGMNIRSERRKEPCVELEEYLSLLSMAPKAWLDAVGTLETDEASPWLVQAWNKVCERHGVAGETELAPRGMEKLSSAGWEPQGEDELKMAALERERRARGLKGPALVQALLSRAQGLGLASEKLKDEAQSVVDYLCDVELGFWEQAPDKISWPWIRARASHWHELMLAEKASATSWEPVEPRGERGGGEPEEGWIDLGSGWRALELINGGALHAEGRAMSHCVSSYAERCAKGERKIFALRHEDESKKSTVELAPLNVEAGWPQGARIIQHRAFANSDPGLESKLAAGRVLERVNKALSNAGAAPRRALGAAGA